MFSGWYTKKTGGTKISSNTKVYFTEKTKTYYAHFFLRRDFNADTLNKKYLKSQSKPKGAWVYKTYIKDDKLIVYGSLDYTAYNPKRTIRLKDIKRIYNLSSDIQLSGFEWCGNKSKQIKEFNKYGNNLLRGGIYFKTVNNKVTYITFAG